MNSYTTTPLTDIYIGQSIRRTYTQTGREGMGLVTDIYDNGNRVKVRWVRTGDVETLRRRDDHLFTNGVQGPRIVQYEFCKTPQAPGRITQPELARMQEAMDTIKKVLQTSELSYSEFLPAASTLNSLRQAVQAIPTY